MVLYAGEAVRIRAVVTDLDTGGPLVIPLGEPAPTAELMLWAPGKNPSRDVEVRDDPDHGPVSMTWRPDESDFIVFVHTRGPDTTADPEGEKWVPGRWSFRVKVEGNAFTNWEYGIFNLRP